jgi:hypothetical protein
MNDVKMSRAEICDEFLKSEGVICCSAIDSESGSYFSYDGCNCCGQGGTSVYDCSGYDLTSNRILNLGEVCHDCLYYFANGV